MLHKFVCVCVCVCVCVYVCVCLVAIVLQRFNVNRASYGNFKARLCL